MAKKNSVIWDKISLVFDDPNEWAKLIGGFILFKLVVWVFKSVLALFGIKPDWDKFGERLTYAWRVLKRPLFTVLVSPLVIKFGLPWFVWQLLRADVSIDWPLKTMFSLGVVAAAISWAWTYQAQAQEELDAVAEKSVRTVLAVSNTMDENVKFDYIKAKPDGSMTLEFKPGIDVDLHGDQIARSIAIASDDAEAHTWTRGTKPDTIRITTFAAKLPELVEPDLTLIGRPEEPNLIWIGVSETGEPIYWDTSYSPHLLLTGKTRGGKGVAVRNILIHAGLHNWEVSVIDPKAMGDYSWCQKAGMSVKEYRGDPYHLYPMCEELGYAVQEMTRRTQKIYSHNDRVNKTGEGKLVENWGQYCTEVRDPGAKEMLVVLDEARAFREHFFKCDEDLKEELQELFKEAVLNIQRLASLSAAVGIHLVVMTQRGDTSSLGGKDVGAAIRENLEARIVCGNADPGSMRMGLAIEDKSDVSGLDQVGRCKYRFLAPGSGQRIYTGQVGYVPGAEVLKHWPQLEPKPIPGYPEQGSASSVLTRPEG